jgi:hypothetical protein
MGFFDTFADTSGVEWVKSEEKNELIAEGTALQVVRAAFRKGQFGPEFVLTFTVPEDGEDTLRGISFQAGSVESRDRFFEALIDYLGVEGNEPPLVHLELRGRSVVIAESSVE